MSHIKSSSGAITPEQLAAMRNQMVNVVKREGMSRKRKLSFVLIGMLLILSPVDLMPEFILGPIGLIDDSGYLVAAVGFAISAVRHRATMALAEVGA